MTDNDIVRLIEGLKGPGDQFFIEGLGVHVVALFPDDDTYWYAGLNGDLTGNVLDDYQMGDVDDIVEYVHHIAGGGG